MSHATLVKSQKRVAPLANFLMFQPTDKLSQLMKIGNRKDLIYSYVAV